VTEDIARQVRARLTTSNRAPFAQPQQVNPDALEAYLQGNYHLSRSGSGFADEELRKAQQYFNEAINADPKFAPAYVGMANAHEGLMRGSRDDWEIAERSAKKAVEIDPAYSDAHDTLGGIRLHRSWDWAGAEEEIRTSIALNRNSAGGHRSLCALLGSLGRLDEALEECQIAQELDPNQDQLSDILYFRREYDRAIEQQLRWLSRYPDNGIGHFELFHCYWQKGMGKEAIQELEQTAVLFGKKEIARLIRQGFVVSGPEGAMRAWAKELEHVNSTNEAFLPLSTAQSYAALGDKDHAFYWLEQAYQHPELVSLDDGLMDLKSDPMLDPLRSDPRYRDLLRRVRLPQ
jgi:tetratricopeptide (TPR) repeat protein